MGLNVGFAEGAAVGAAEGKGVGDSIFTTAVTFVLIDAADVTPNDEAFESDRITDSTAEVKIGMMVAELPTTTLVDTLYNVKLTVRLRDVEVVDEMPTDSTLEITDDDEDPAAAFTVRSVE